MIQKRLKDTITSIPNFFSTTRFIALNLDTISSFIFKGGISIDTELVDQTNICGFRTVIQPDGDIINILPSTNKFSTDLYNRTYNEHYEKIQRLLNNLVDGLISIKWLISAIFGFLANYFFIIKAYSNYLDDSQEIIQLALFVVLVFLLTYLFQKFAVKYIFRLIFLIMKNWFKSR
jgi:hypothetical protein